jgi:transcriptional regulator with XRE-family HTH domain
VTAVHPIIRELGYIRYVQGLTRRVLAERIGRSPATVAAWEAGRRHPTIIALEDWVSGLGYALAVNPTDAAPAIPEACPTNRRVCGRCGRDRRHKAKGLCVSCYTIERRKAAS